MIDSTNVRGQHSPTGRDAVPLLKPAYARIGDLEQCNRGIAALPAEPRFFRTASVAVCDTAARSSPRCSRAGAFE